MKRREFITLLGGRGVAARGACAAGRAGAAHRRAIPLLRTMRSAGPQWRRSSKGCSNWGGPSDTTSDRKSMGSNTPNISRQYAAELVALAPDVILAPSGKPSAIAAGDPQSTDRVRARCDPSAPASSRAGTAGR